MQYFIIKTKDPNLNIDTQYQELFKLIEGEGLKITHSVSTGNEIHFILDLIKK